MHKIAVNFKNQKERENMWSFLSTLPWPSIIATENGHEVETKRGENDNYSKLQGRTKIVFNSRVHPQWLWALAAWMATKSSYKINDEWSVVVVDDEEFPVISHHFDTNKALIVENDGVLKYLRHNPEINLDGNAQKEFIKEINSRWNNFNQVKTKKSKKTSKIKS